MRCDIVSFAVPDIMNPGVGRAAAKCRTHDWYFAGIAQETCPIGRIEAARDDAISKIMGLTSDVDGERG